MQNEVPIVLPKKRQLSKEKMAPSVECFLAIMLFVIAIQGTYLAYVVGILTNLEREFGISSKKSGALLSFYDIGYTISVVLIGFLANNKHLSRITAMGALLSAVSMFILALPTVLFRSGSSDETATSSENKYILKNICDPSRVAGDSEQFCKLQEDEHFLAFCILTIGQILAGIGAAPFNTVAYVYVDNNLEDKTKSPFYLSLLSGMYAFAPGFGFASSAGATMLYTSILDASSRVTINSDEWIGAWWLGFIIFGLSYLISAVLLMFFPNQLFQNDSNGFEMQQLRNEYPHDHDDYQISVFENYEKQEERFCDQLKEAITEIPRLLKNPVFSSTIIGWMFGSYLTSGYSTYLPKYLETQFGRSASAADIFAGVISIGSIAVSTTLGGYLLTKLNPSPRKALLLLIFTWFIIVVTYLIGSIVGCDKPQMKQLLIGANSEVKFNFNLECSSGCQCNQVDLFNPVNYQTMNYFSPCHAGCREYNFQLQKWNLCSCADDGPVETGLYLDDCNAVYIYVTVMFIGLFFGNLFFMTTMMIVLRSIFAKLYKCVNDDKKVLALSFASCITNIMGFIPGPIIFGWIIDEDCLLWHSKCPHDRGNCIIYDNKIFRQSFHFTCAGFQFLAVISIIICYTFSRKFRFPEEKRDEEIYDEYAEKQIDDFTLRLQQTVL